MRERDGERGRARERERNTLRVYIINEDDDDIPTNANENYILFTYPLLVVIWKYINFEKLKPNKFMQIQHILNGILAQ